jgi:hypothetical protein
VRICRNGTRVCWISRTARWLSFTVRQRDKARDAVKYSIDSSLFDYNAMHCNAMITPPFPTRIHRTIVQNPTIHMLALILSISILVKAKTMDLGEKRTKRGEEPSVLSRGVSLLKSLLDGLLRVLPLRHLLERVRRHRTLQALQLQRISRGHQVVVVDDLDKGLDLAALGLARLGHAAGDLRGVALDAGDQGVRVWVRLVAGVLGLDDHNL